MERYTYEEIKQYLKDYNKKHNYTTKGTDTHCVVVAVISQDSFEKEYSLDERSYVFTNDNKAFIEGQLGSIFADSKDGSDRAVRLEQYLEEEGNPGGWKVEYCYILKED